MTYKTNEGKTYAIVGTVNGTVASASGVEIASFTANKQSYFTAPAGGYVTISDETAIVTPVFKLAPSALVGESGGGDTPAPSGDYGDFVGYIEYDDETGAIVDLSIPKYLGGNLTFKNEVLPENYEWKFDMPYLANGNNMFNGCTNLASFSGDLSALTDGQYMFSNCSNLTEWNISLSALTTGTRMFYYCTNLRSFSGDLPKLIYGSSMFLDCTNLASFSGDLSALNDGSYMFQGCNSLTSFSGDLSALNDGSYMFQVCRKLRSFSGDLSKLTNGKEMFLYCKLDAASVERILTTIPTYTDGSTHELELWFSSEAAAKFAEITGVTLTTSLQTVSYKGWTIKAKING